MLGLALELFWNLKSCPVNVELSSTDYLLDFIERTTRFAEVRSAALLACALYTAVIIV